MTVLTNLVGGDVVTALVIHDYFQLFFSEDIIVSVYNSYSIIGSTVKGLQGKKLLSVSESELEIELVFEGLAKVRIDMSPDGFNGPEAMQLSKPGFPRVIWN
ncbi:hypothetical protein [Pseudomonas syringae]|uniref:hypothetical protein n=1 Tax=Pseudomonas syringae TaxID=317 RepID=UPI0032048488